MLEDGDERRALGRIQLQHRLHQVDQLHAVFARRHLAERLVSVSCVRIKTCQRLSLGQAVKQYTSGVKQMKPGKAVAPLTGL